MALSDFLLSPLGLLALGSILPLLALYLLKPDPDTVEIPTLAFLGPETERNRASPIFRRLQRELLLVLQLLALILLALALAAPYVMVSAETTVEETVLVVDGSASMATTDGGQSRFSRAIGAAKDAVTSRTSLIVSAEPVRIRLRRAPQTEATRLLDQLRVTGTEGDLRTAIARATAIAGEDARIVVLSDFVDSSDWQTAVRSARAQGYDVSLEQFAAGGEDNVGIVGYSFASTAVDVRIKNFGDSTVTRRLALGNQSIQISLQSGDIVTRRFTIPDGGGEIRLTPGDSFGMDDRLPIAAPQDPTVRVLVVSNDRNRNLETALSVIEQVDLTIKSPPASITNQYDVVIFSGVNPDRLLSGTVQVAQETLARGGGVVIQAQPRRELTRLNYGDLLLVAPTGMADTPTLADPSDHPLTSDIAFPAPTRHVTGRATDGQPLVRTINGTPLVAIGDRRGGRVLYYGYLQNASAFQYNYRYPVFWKRAIFHLTDRPSLARLNRQTGTRLQFASSTVVQTPSGRQEGESIRIDQVGFYTTESRQYGAGLVSREESAVETDPIDSSGIDAVTGRVEQQRIPRELTHFVIVGVIAVLLLELLVLRRRGDL
ncbi:MAG: VWA domain-containing protein [Halobacteriales archaeon]